jgi:hypothetical protein
MTRYIIKREETLGRHAELVQRLAKELAYGDRPQPAFIEQLMPYTNSRHVYVIWDQWTELPEDERSDIILRAYSSHEGDASDNIAFGVGMTGQEALDVGLLPYVVQPVGTKTHTEKSLLREERAKKTELANTILGSRAKHLRYPTNQAAEEAVERLCKAAPKSKWTITHEIMK